MNKFLTILSATTALAVSAAFADSKTETNHKNTANGGYETSVKSESEDAAGTKKTTETSVDVNVKGDGRVERKAESESVTDPKGLMNKKTTDNETKFTEKANGGYKQVTTSKSRNAEGSNVTYVTTTDVDVDNNGNVTTTAKTEKTVDPKGLMNKTTTTTESKSVNGRVVEKTQKVD